MRCLTYGQRTWTEPLLVSSGRPTAILGDEASLATIETVPRRAGIEFIDEYGGGPGVRFRKGHHKEDGD